MNKHKSIRKLSNLIAKTFGKDTFEIRDYWDDFFAIGFERNKRLIYISTYGLKPGNFFYECEILLENEKVPYVSYGKAENVDISKIMQTIESFFEIDNRSLK